MGQASDDDPSAEQARAIDAVRGPSRIDTLPTEVLSAISRRPRLLGEVIGTRYKLVQALGDGAMGQVFVAENLAMGRRVAVKLLKPELLSDEMFRKRFQHEAMAIAAIEHRNVARFIDLIVGDPTFLVMEFVPGPTLAEVLRKEKRLEPIRAVNLVRRLCWALDAVHRAGIVHRDVKPANVILAPDPELGEEPKLIDFGLAKLAFANAEEQLTRAGQFVGTPHYMSPEQIASRDIDARSDVYSLGCLLYHLVAGRPPFAGTDDVQILFKQMQEAPAPVAASVADVPLELDLVLRCALAKEPSGRFASMREMQDALSKIERRRLPEPDETARTAPKLAALTPPPRSRALPWIVAGALAGAALTVGVGRLVRSRVPDTLVVVTSRPAGAAVDVDDHPSGQTTPAALTGLSPGEHRVRVRAANRDPVLQPVKLAEHAREAVDVILPPASHTVEVQTIPSGATVFVDDQQVMGQTPLSIALADDDFHAIRLEKSGYESELTRVTPEDHRPQLSIALRAETHPEGSVTVDSNLSAEVWIDGKNSGYTTPTLAIRLPVGAHAIELRDSTGQRSSATRVEVKQGDTVHLRLNTNDRCGER